MTRIAITAIAMLAASWCAAQAAGPLQFWNTSSREFTGVYLAAPGTTQWSPNQTASDPDGSVAADERLKLRDAKPGHYDVRLVDKTGKTCVVKNVEARATGPYAFSIGDEDLKTCRR
jgi:hypothetical protein